MYFNYFSVRTVFRRQILMSEDGPHNKKLYCALIDYSKAFDTVWRKGLWYNLLKKGITGKIFDIVNNIYQNIKSYVASEGKLSDFFVSNAGVRQGENLSLLLFSIYVDDLENYLSAKGSVPLEVDKMFNTENVLKFLVLLYADDILILADSPVNLQKCLHNLSLYCEKWHLTVNENKTKIMIFSKRNYLIVW